MVSDLQVRNADAKIYDEQYLKQNGYWHDWVEKKVILDTLDLKPTDIVLEAGCGTGRITLELAKRCKFVYAMDYSKGSLEVLEQKLKDLNIHNVVPLTWDIRYPLDCLLEYEKVDKVTSVQVIQHLPTVGRYEAIDNLYNYLKPNGVCVVLVYNALPFYFGKLIGKGLKRNGVFPNGISYHRFFDAELRVMFMSAGFKNISVKGCVNFSAYEYLNSKLFYPLACLDTRLSNLNVSCITGTYLIAKGVK